MGYKYPCPKCDKQLMPCNVRINKENIAYYSQDVTPEPYYSCINKCITNVSQSLLKSYYCRWGIAL